MTPADVSEIWSMLDRDYLAAVARSHTNPVFATISGAHLYGFASPDSDVDLRGAFVQPLSDVLGLQPSRETITVEDKSRLDLDWVAHDVRKFARMMVNHNGYVLEQLFSPLVVVTSDAHQELLALGRGCVTRPTVRHYLGFARGRRLRLAEPAPTVKHLLYAYRVYLSGIHLMQTGEVVAHLPTLNQRFRLTTVDELIARKRAGAEKMLLAADELAQHARWLDELESQLHAAHDASALPNEATSVAALNDLVIRVRMTESRGL